MLSNKLAVNFLIGCTMLLCLLATTEVVIPKTKANVNVAILNKFDFQRIGQQRGKLMLELASSAVVSEVKRNGANLEVYLQNTKLATNIANKYEVNDFVTPVEFITLQQVNAAVKITLQARGKWSFISYQTDNIFNLEVFEETTSQKLVRQNMAKKISLNFQDIPLRQMLHIIADFSGFNIVVADTVKGNLSVRLKQVPWDQALEIILQTKGLAKRQEGNVIWVALAHDIAAKELEELKNKSKLNEFEPVVMQAFQLHYAKAGATAKVIGAGNGRVKILSPRGSVVAEERTNQLFITDTKAKLAELTAMINQLDKPVKQVLIEARIVEANDNFGRSLGIKLGGQDTRPYEVFNKNIAFSPGYGSSMVGGNAIAVGGSLTGPAGLPNIVNLPAIATGGRDVAIPALAFTIFGANVSRFISLELSAMETTGEGKIISSPRVIASDQNPAIIEQGTEIPYSTVSEAGTNVEFKKANLKLEVTPHITPDGSIILDLDVTKDSPNTALLDGREVVIDTKHIKTQALVADGGTVVVGGIYQIIESNTINKVPLLGDIPLLGNLFKNRTRKQDKSEMLVFITPRILEK